MHWTKGRKGGRWRGKKWDPKLTCIVDVKFINDSLISTAKHDHQILYSNSSMSMTWPWSRTRCCGHFSPLHRYTGWDGGGSHLACIFTHADRRRRKPRRAGSSGTSSAPLGWVFTHRLRDHSLPSIQSAADHSLIGWTIQKQGGVPVSPFSLPSPLLMPAFHSFPLLSPHRLLPSLGIHFN